MGREATEALERELAGTQHSSLEKRFCSNGMKANQLAEAIEGGEREGAGSSMKDNAEGGELKAPRTLRGGPDLTHITKNADSLRIISPSTERAR